MRSRRRFLTASAVSIPVIAGVAGCLDRLSQEEAPPDTPTDTPTDELNVENPDPVNAAVFDAWEPDTNCNEGEQESMYNSEISVQDVHNDLSDRYNPIAYDDLPDDEKQILATMLENGGYATCETSGAFRSFTEKAVYEYAAEQNEDDDLKVFLEYDDTYYRIYIRQQDQVYAY